MEALKKMFFILAIIAAFGFAGCEREGPAERTGEEIDEAVEEVKDGAEEAGEEIDEAAEDVKEGVEEAGEELEEATEQ